MGAKILTPANQPFEIKQFNDLSSSNGKVKFQSYDIVMKGVPRVSRDQTILLDLELKREYANLSWRNKKVNFGSGSMIDAGKAGQIAKTELKLTDGETTILNWTFPSDDDRPGQKNLMIFITPRIM